MRVDERMQRDVITVDAGDSLGLARQLMLWHGIRHVPVLRDGEILGVLTDRLALQHADEITTPVAELVPEGPPAVLPSTSVADASARMVTEGHDYLLVVDDGELIGILTPTDLLGQLAQDPVGPPSERRTVADVVTRNLQVASGDDYLLDAAARMAEKSIRHLPVVDGKRRLVGILSDRDLRNAVGDPVELLSEPERAEQLKMRRVDEVMTPNPVACHMNEPLDAVIDTLGKESIGALPVVDDLDHVVGIVSYVDVLNTVVARGHG